MILKRGIRSVPVRVLQNRLFQLVGPCEIDGIFGSDTESLVKQFQMERGMVIDGVVGPKTMKQLAKEFDWQLNVGDVELVATRLDVNTASIKAVIAVESRGSGFFGDVAPAILYERHVMRRRLYANGVDNRDVQRYFNLYPNIVNKATGGYEGGLDEYERLQLASSLHEKSALESCSWGMFQIMGFHWNALGYNDVYHFVNSMCDSEGAQLEAFEQFIKINPKMHLALQHKDWAEFAKRYNGVNYSKNNYDIKLRDAYEKFK